MDKFEFAAMVYDECQCGPSVFIRPDTPDSCTLMITDNPALQDMLSKLHNEGYTANQLDDFFPVMVIVRAA